MTFRHRVNEENADGSIGRLVLDLRGIEGTESKLVEAVRAFAGAAPVPTPTPTPTPNPTPTPTPTALHERIIGSVISVDAAKALGGVFANYESKVAAGFARHWTAQGSNWDGGAMGNLGGNYYDRAKAYYAWWLRTGNAEYRQRADAIALSYRDGYILSQRVQAYWLFPDGLAIHYALTKDAKTASALNAMAQHITGSYYWDHLSGSTSNGDGAIDNRTRAKAIQIPAICKFLGLPSLEDPKIAVDAVLSSQRADGNLAGSLMGDPSPFMTGILHEALMTYYDLVAADARIPTAIQRSLAYLKRHLDTASMCFREGSSVSGETNMLVVPSYGFVFKHLGDQTARTTGDAVFAGGVNKAYWDGSKQFNQTVCQSYKYLALRH